MFPSSAQWVPKFPMRSPRVRVRENSPPHLCFYEWERELTSLPPFRPITRWTNLLASWISNGRTDGRTHIETLNPKPEHTQEDTPDTEWYPLPWVLANRIWLGKDCCLAEFQHFTLRCIKIPFSVDTTERGDREWVNPFTHVNECGWVSYYELTFSFE
jgi:hypothetical protein